MAASGVSNAAITTVGSLTAQKRLIEAGLGIALMPTSSVREELRIGRLRAIELTTLKAHLPVVAIRAATAFLEVLADHTPDLNPD